MKWASPGWSAVKEQKQLWKRRFALRYRHCPVCCSTIWLGWVWKAPSVRPGPLTDVEYWTGYRCPPCYVAEMLKEKG